MTKRKGPRSVWASADGMELAGVLIRRGLRERAAIFPQTKAAGVIAYFGATIQLMNQASQFAEQQWQQARDLLAAGDSQKAVSLLESATTALHLAASFNLGCLHLFALIDDADRQRGTALIQRAADSGHAGALYQLAMLELSKPTTQPNWQYANECLQKSAQQGFPTALRSLAIHWSRGTEETLLQLGTLCLEHAARGGDIVSLALLMHRLYDGVGCNKNSLRASAINTLLLQSSLSVDPPATVANPQLAQTSALIDLPQLPLPRLQNDLRLTALEMISHAPWVGIADDVITQEESYLIRYTGGPQLNPSVTATPEGKRLQVQLRTSFDMVYEEMLEDITVLLIERRMAAMVNTTPAHSEYLQLLRYQNGQEYRPHRDYLPASMITPLAQGGSGQRESTVIIYLNDVDKGGETQFMELDKKITPKMGRALAFRNLLADGTPDTRTLHAGLPVETGTKWIATMWIRQGIFRQ